MAAPKKTETTQAVQSDRVTIRLPRIPGQKVQDDYVLSVNGRRFQIQRGVEVNVPRYVAETIELFEREKDEAERITFEMISD
jgi:hypothetical protein